MKKPVLVVMAAGMGNRYGGLKQMDPVDDHGRVILDYSVHDAVKAGFEDVIFIIKEEMEESFRSTVCKRMDGHVNYGIVFQKLEDIPEGYVLPKDRVKPLGTGHAVRSIRSVIGEHPFAVINADDYYGSQSFKLVYDFLSDASVNDNDCYCCIAYNIENTVTENGSVSRGVCRTDSKGYLAEITERTRVEKRPGGAAYTEDDGKTWGFLPAGTPVSMNFWGFTSDFISELDERFGAFLEKGLRENPMKCEYFLPFVVDEVRREGKKKVKVISTHDEWHGVTYKEDKPALEEALKKVTW